MKITVLFILSVFFLISCSNDDLKENEANENQQITMKSVQSGSNDEKTDYHSKIELGEELLNPYSVEAMQDAFDYYNSLVENSDFEGKEVSATHYYIRITPENESHLEFLDNLDKSDDVDVPVIHDFQ